MQIDHIALDRLSVSKANMRSGKKPPDITDILPSVLKRGVLSPLFVRPNCSPDHYEIVAGKRRYFASLEAARQGQDDILLPCIILAEGDDAEALEISMIENMLRQNPDSVTQWESFTRLVKSGRSVEDIAATFALTALQVKRILALGNLLPRIREAFRDEEIDAGTVKHLTLATKAQQKAWLALFEDADAYAPRGNQLKAWLFGGASISVRMALFDVGSYAGQIVADLFDEDGYFADADSFWFAQKAEVEARKARYLDEGWADVVVVPPSEYFSVWEYEKSPKRKGGRVYIQLRDNGEVAFHEGYLTRKEAQRVHKGDSDNGGGEVKASRPEVTAALNAYVDRHRHAAVRCELAARPGIALRVMVAHAIYGSHLWSVKVEDGTRFDAVNASVAASAAEARFDERRQAIIDLLGCESDCVTQDRNGSDLVPLVARLLELPDTAVMEVLAVVMAETLASGSELVETLGLTLGIDMVGYWQADQAFFDMLRDREVMTALLGEIGGETVAAANAREKGKVIKGVIADYLGGSNGRVKVEGWVPRWMAFPPAAYTVRGGVATVTAAERARWLLEREDDPASDDITPLDAGENIGVDGERLAA